VKGAIGRGEIAVVAPSVPAAMALITAEVTELAIDG
jgi:hypothetical protein